ncbi:MAG: right-handed parallel beta-helix repeat-containing protein [Elainellaceae cyanobacterium]
MKNSVFITTAGVSVIFSLMIAQSAIAQSANPATSDSDADASSEIGSAADLRISPRIGVGYTTSGAGFDGITRFEGFLPFRQIPGQDITYFEPRFTLDNDGNVGGTLLFGHRAYSEVSDRIWGGYASVDNRRTDHSDFYQLGLGLESLGEVWDFRLNGYIPLGDTRQLVEDRSFDTGFDLSSGFEGNLFVLSSRREQQRVRIREAALGGFDAEVGARITEWNDGDGDLRGYTGLYFYDAKGTNSSLGWRLGLDVRPVQNIVLGISVQDDDIFGTNVVGSFSLTWPRVRSRGPIIDGQEVIARLGEPTRRTPTIAVDTQEDIETTIEETIAPLMNPEEEEPYRFVHVTLGRGSQGDGTFENPFGSLQSALDDSISDGSGIVYVDAGSNPEIPAFTIPDRVRVLSQGPVQFLAGMPFPGFPEAASRLPFSPVVNFNDGILVRLPLSEDGNFPIIRDVGATNLVTMGDRTVLSGFQILDAPNNAVAATSVENVEIRDNTITNAGDRGVFLNDVSGSVVMLDNIITGSRGGASSGQGILIANQSSEAIEVTIENHRIQDNRIGIEIIADGNLPQALDPSQIVNIDTTQIRNSREQGLSAQTNELGNQQISFTQGSIFASGAEGVFVQASNVGSQEVTLEDSTIANNGDSGIRVVGGIPNGSSTAAQEVFINRNRIEQNGGAGIEIEGNEGVAQEFAIGNNLIQNNAGGGIQAIARNFSFQEYVSDDANNSLGISNNIIQNNGGQGIVLRAENAATLIADIQGNTLSGNETGGQPDLDVSLDENTNDVCAVLINNSAENGIRLSNNVGGVAGFFEVGNLTMVPTLNSGDVSFLPDISTFTNIPDAASCFEN